MNVKEYKVCPGTLGVSTTVAEDVVKPLRRLTKGLIKAEITCGNVILPDFLRMIAPTEEVIKRLYFLKRFGFPLGCIENAYDPWSSPVRDYYTQDGLDTIWKYDGVKFMHKIIKPTKKGWQVEFIY